MDTVTELADVYSRDGDTVTLTMCAEEFLSRIAIKDLAVHFFERTDDHLMVLNLIAMNNFIQRGNKDFIPIAVHGGMESSDRTFPLALIGVCR